MEAVYINHIPPQAPFATAQAVSAFLRSHPAALVEDRLWQTFVLAVKGGLVNDGPIPAEEVALLFDQLIALLRTLETAQQSGSGAPYPKGGSSHV